MSMINPGTSINFDGHVLEEQAEAELEKEDQKCQQELRELLTTALPDDLLDDDGSSSFSSLSPDKTQSPEPWQVPQQQLHKWADNLHGLHAQLLQQEQISTPQGDYVNRPPFKAPNAFQDYRYSSGSEEQNKQLTKQDGLHHHGNQHMTGYDRGEIEGADSDEEYTHGGLYRNDQYDIPNGDPVDHGVYLQGRKGHRDNGLQQYGKDLQQPNNNYHYGNEVGCTEKGGHKQGYSDAEQYQNGIVPQTNTAQMYGTPCKPALPSNRPEEIQTHNRNRGEEVYEWQTTSRPQNGMLENGQCYVIDQTQSGYQPPREATRPVAYRGQQYRGDGTMDIRQVKTDGKVNGVSDGAGDGRFGKVLDVQADDAVQMQQQFLETANNEESRQLAQLQILCKAKSRELEHVVKQLETLKDDSAREKRILNHQLALANGERDGATMSFEQNRGLLMTCNQEKAKLEEELQTKEDQMQALTISKEELLEKLNSAECTIDNLAQQCQTLQASAPHSKYNRDHDNILASIQEKHQQEVNALKEKLDKFNNIIIEKGLELKTLQEELRLQRKTMDQTRVDHAEAVNQLTRSLEVSQAQCRQYLESGPVEEISQLKIQLKQTSTARDLSQNTCTSLQDELHDLKEQLQMYESAAELGVLSSKVSPQTSDSFAQLKVRNLDMDDWETPKSHRSETSGHLKLPSSLNEDVVLKLRTELERALRSNRAKRSLVMQLQEQIRASTTECSKLKDMAEAAEFNVKDMKMQMQNLQSPNRGHTGEQQASTTKIGLEDGPGNSRELESLKEVCEMLKRDLEKQADQNAELKKQMMIMVDEHDDDKKSNMERVQNTCLQLHEDRSKQMREHIVGEWEAERDMLKEAHQHQLQQIRLEVESAQKELCEVKGLYVAVCEEKNNIEDQVTKRMRAESENLLTKTVAEVNDDKTNAVETMKQMLESDYRAKLLTAKADWQKEASKLADMDMQLKLAAARVEWNETARKQAVDSATRAVEAEWQTKLDLQVENKLKEQLAQAKTALESKYQEDLAEQLEKVKSDSDESHKTALTMALAEAESEWKEKSQVTLAESIQVAVKECRNQLLASDSKMLELVDKAVADARAKWLTETVDWTEVKTRWMKEDGYFLIQQKVLQAKDELSRQHYKEIADLQSKCNELECVRKTSIKEAEEKLEKEHEAFLLEHKDTLTKALQAARGECEKDKVNLLQQKSLEYQNILAERQRQWQVEREVVVDKCHQETEKRLAKLQDKLVAQEESFRNEQRAEDTKHAQELEAALDEAKQQWNQKCDAQFRKKYSEKLERKEHIWGKEREDLLQQLTELESKLDDVRDDAHQNMKKQKERHVHTSQQTEDELKLLREKLCTSQRQQQKTEYRLKRELHHLKSQLTCTNSATLEAMEGRIAELQRKHIAAITRLKDEHQRERERWSRQKNTNGDVGDTTSRGIQTFPQSDDRTSPGDGLNELRSHYLETVHKIRGDVLKYVTDMREQCRQTVHTEVMKERNCTAKKLRQYYLQCLHRLMQEEDDPRSKQGGSASKFAAMAKALELPEDDLSRQHEFETREQFDSRVSECQPTPIKEPIMSQETGGVNNVKRWLQRQESSDEGSHCFGPMKSATASTLSGHTIVSIVPITRIPPDDYLDTSGEMGRNCNVSLDVPHTDTLSRLPRQPREFNPSPERLASTSQTRSEKNDYLGVQSMSNVLANVTLRSRQSSPARSECSIDQDQNKDCNSTSVNDAMKTRRTPVVISGNSAKRVMKTDSVIEPIRKGITQKDGVTKVPIKSHSRTYEKQAVSSQMSGTMLKAAPASDQMPATLVSSASLATEYHDLPDTLDIATYPSEVASHSASRAFQASSAKSRETTDSRAKVPNTQKSRMLQLSGAHNREITDSLAKQLHTKKTAHRSTENSNVLYKGRSAQFRERCKPSNITRQTEESKIRSRYQGKTSSSLTRNVSQRKGNVASDTSQSQLQVKNGGRPLMLPANKSGRPLIHIPHHDSGFDSPNVD